MGCTSISQDVSLSELFGTILQKLWPTICSNFFLEILHKIEDNVRSLDHSGVSVMGL